MLARRTTEISTTNKVHYYHFYYYSFCHQFVLWTACLPSPFPVLRVVTPILLSILSVYWAKFGPCLC